MAKRTTPKVELEDLLKRFDRELDAQVDARTAAQIRAVIADASADLIVATPARRLATLEQSIKLMLGEKNKNLALVHLGIIETGRARVLRDFAKKTAPEIVAMLEVLARDPRTYTAADGAVIAKALPKL